MPGMLFFIERFNTEIGQMLLVTDERERVRALDWQEYESRMRLLVRRQYHKQDVQLVNIFARSKPMQTMENYFQGDLSALKKIPIAHEGSEFQKLVWAELRNIEPGSPISYGTLAQRIGKPRAVRAVGLANGANPIGIIVPCHRVIGANQSLTGYGGGLKRKQWLLDHEVKSLVKCSG